MNDPTGEVTVRENGSVRGVVVTEEKTGKYVVWRRNLAYIIIFTGLMSVMFMFVAFTWLLRESQQSISDLTDQLREARSEIEINADEVQRRETCRLRYTSAITEQQAAVLIAFSRAVGVEATDIEREFLITQINQAGDRLESAIADRASYEAAGAPLPCPL